MRLPPLNAIRTFEVAGRLGNFSRAAAELNVTPGAVSRQIGKLEDHLGARLFERGTELRLTEQGQAYLVTVQDALSRLDEGTRIFDEQTAQPLQIWGSRFFIRLWLIPRLPDFYQKFPGQELAITSARPSDPLPTEFDVAIRLGTGAWKGLNADLLAPLSLLPVCSPAYLQTAPPLTSPQDLTAHKLLQTPKGAEDWDHWCDMMGVSGIDRQNRITLTSTDMAYSAALDGLGIVLGRRGFFENDVLKGNLVVPFPQSYQAPDGFYLLYSDRQPLPRRITQFRGWIKSLLPDFSGQG